jgi:hypothetical protein
VLQNLVLAQREELFEDVLADREADDDILPGEEGTVEEPGDALLEAGMSAFREGRGVE